MIDAVQAVSALVPSRLAGAEGVDGAGLSNSFSETLRAGLVSVDTKIAHADALMQAYATGENVAVHEVALALSQARIAVELAAEVRNRLLESFREIMNMQV